MIQSIEVWNFEAHEHSVMDNLSPGLNGVFGDSDVGKTSMVRALKLAAYNEFDPKSVRVGAKNCRVKVTSDRGYVDVTRGTKNEWEVCRNGEAPINFSKIGKKVLPEAAEVLGLRMVELGDQSLPVNIMDQGENHFMLNELGGTDASGSMRAQVIDEISGLSGIEGLINAVSLDRHRAGRQVKEAEDKAQALRDSKHDEQVLQKEEATLQQVQELVRRSDENADTAQALGNLFQGHDDASKQAEEAEILLRELPNTKRLTAIINKAQTLIERRSQLQALQASHVEAIQAVGETQKALSAMPSLDVTRDELQKCDYLVRRAVEAHKYAEALGDAIADLNEAQATLDAMPDIDKAYKALQQCEDTVQQAVDARKHAEALGDAMADLDEAQDQLVLCETELSEAQHAHTEALQDIELCPLTGKPVSDWCFEGIELPEKT